MVPRKRHDPVIGLGVLVLAIWLFLMFGRGGFWRCRDLDDVDAPPALSAWPSVVAVVPARDEAALIAKSLGSLLAQDYPGDFRVVLVDDQSSDGTVDKARESAAASPHSYRLTVLPGAPLPAGWTGKVWAMAQGEIFARKHSSPDYLLFTDADIFHAPGNMRAVAARAESGAYGLVSLMAAWRCESAAEKWLIPAFTYFFQLIYPFRWVSDSRRKTAAAAGNLMLARADLLAKAGGVAAISNALIDDCAFGALMKGVGPVWLGLSKRLRSLRAYPRFADIGRMVSRSAFAQLRFSYPLLALTSLGLVLTFFVPVLLAFFADGPAGVLGIAAFILMSVSFAPVQRFYGLPRWRAATLPLIAAPYLLYTLESAWAYSRGRGGMWKGRAQAHLARTEIETERP